VYLTPTERVVLVSCFDLRGPVAVALHGTAKPVLGPGQDSDATDKRPRRGKDQRSVTFVSMPPGNGGGKGGAGPSSPTVSSGRFAGTATVVWASMLGLHMLVGVVARQRAGSNNC
jgi:hypothetical protein